MYGGYRDGVRRCTVVGVGSGPSYLCCSSAGLRLVLQCTHAARASASLHAMHAAALRHSLSACPSVGYLIITLYITQSKVYRRLRLLHNSKYTQSKVYRRLRLYITLYTQSKVYRRLRLSIYNCI